MELLKHSSYNSINVHAPVWVTFNVAFEKIRQRSEATADLLRACSLLAPDPIPEEIFTRGKDVLGEELGSFLPDKLNILVSDAGRFSLLSRDVLTHTLIIHSVVQQVIRDSMELTVQRLWIERMVRAIDIHLLDVDFSQWAVYERLLPHALVCASHISQRNLRFAEAAHLIHQSGWYLGDRKQNGQNEALFKNALDIREQVLGPEHPDTARTLNNLGNFYHAVGRHSEAEPLLKRSLDIVEKVLGPEHPDTAIALGNLGSFYRDVGRNSEAEPLLKQALDIVEKVLGPEHPDTASALGNLGSFYHAVGRHSEAEQLKKKALSVLRRTLGKKHPLTKNTCKERVQLLIKLGRLRDAREAQKQC